MLMCMALLQMTFPIRPNRVQDSGAEMGSISQVEGKPAEPSSGLAAHDADLSIAQEPDVPSRLPPLSCSHGRGRPKQVPEDFLHLFGKKAGKLPVQSSRQ